jgi:exodeoxyribonuclease VII large subunit
MPAPIKLSELISEVEEVIEGRFGGELFWITAEITDVKKYGDKRWCFLKFIEKESNKIVAEIKGVFWSNTYNAIEKFERTTGSFFSSGIEINCCVRVRFHKRFGLDLEVMDIDCAYTLGKLEIEKQQVLDRLIKDNPGVISLVDGQYITANNTLELPSVIQRVALITAPSSDGQRDFRQELEKNSYGYAFYVKEFLTTVQGDTASRNILSQLEHIEVLKDNFDVVAIIRGGGSQTDFKPFDDYELCRFVASFPLPVLTGIGHDRNTSIVDMMARQHKTPTKVAAYIIDVNFNFEREVLFLKERFFRKAEDIADEARRMLAEVQQAIEEGIKSLIEDKKLALTNMKRMVRSMSPETIMNKGFAIITMDNKIMAGPEEIEKGSELKILLKNKEIYSTVTDKEDIHENPIF